jgi:hypothetical protein
VLQAHLLYSLWFNTLNTTLSALLNEKYKFCMYILVSERHLFSSILYNETISVPFPYNERPCFTPIKWYKGLKCNVYNKFIMIYHTCSSWRGSLRCRLFAVDSVDTWGICQVPPCLWLSLQYRGSVVALYSWQMPVSGRETKIIYNSSKWIHFCNFNHVAQSWNM